LQEFLIEHEGYKIMMHITHQPQLNAYAMPQLHRVAVPQPVHGAHAGLHHRALPSGSRVSCRRGRMFATTRFSIVAQAGGNGEVFEPQVCVVLGTQWGDEGKGKLVDILAQQYDIVARAQVRFQYFQKPRLK
jgi:hypothetical protein